MTLLRYLPFFVYRTYCRQKSVSQGVYGASTIDKTSKTQLGGGSTEKTCVLQIAYGAFTIAKNSKTWSGSDPTKIRFTNSIWRVYHWQNSKNTIRRRLLQLRFILRIAYGASTIDKTPKHDSAAALAVRTPIK